MVIESSARRHRVCGSACTRACSAVSGVLTSLSCVVAQGRSATQRSGSTAFSRDHMSVGTLLSVCGSTTSQASRKGRPQSLFCESLDVLLYSNGTPHTHTRARTQTLVGTVRVVASLLGLTRPFYSALILIMETQAAAIMAVAGGMKEVVYVSRNIFSSVLPSLACL